jgi:hypothetical protein
VADAADFEALYALKALTNERIRDELGDIALVPPADRVFGPGSGPIMASFTHLNPNGSRFSDGSYGVFYAAATRQTAVEETRYHHGNFLRATRQAPCHLSMRMYSVRIDAELHDLRGGQPALREVHDPASYAASRALAAGLRKQGSAGVAYDSVRDPGGECVACSGRAAHANASMRRTCCTPGTGNASPTCTSISAEAGPPSARVKLAP